MAGIDVIVCTYNRASKLRNLLRSFESAQIPTSVDVQLIVVDNGSDDETHEAVKVAAGVLAIPVRYLRCDERGLARSRNVGISATRGDIIAFTDDDCIVSAGWIASIWSHFQLEPELAVLGGRIEQANPAAYPLTLQLGSERERLTSARRLIGFIHGCNLAFRREVLQRVGYFDERFGPGTPLKAADDADFVYRCYRAGCSIDYVPDVRVFHDHGRLRFRDAVSVINAYSTANGALVAKHVMSGNPGAWELLKWRRARSSMAVVKGANRFVHVLLGAVWFALSPRQPQDGLKAGVSATRSWPRR